MKLSSLALLAAVGAAVMPAGAAAQSASHHKDDHHPKNEQHAASGWKELDAFHELMAATWHPARSKDLKPIRAKADSLAWAAKTWAAAPAPHGCDSREIRAAIADVVTGSAGVATLVTANASDADLYKALHDVHERFEVVEHGCKPGKHPR